MDIHLAWRAEGCSCAGGEVFMGTAPWTQLRAAEELLRSARVRTDVARLVAGMGEVVPLDAIVTLPGEELEVVSVDGPARDGFRAAMVTIGLSGADGDRYIEVLSGLVQGGHEDRQIGFVVVMGARDEGASLLGKLNQAKTIRMAELPLLVQEQPGRASAPVV